MALEREKCDVLDWQEKPGTNVESHLKSDLNMSQVHCKDLCMNNQEPDRFIGWTILGIFQTTGICIYNGQQMNI